MNIFKYLWNLLSKYSCSSYLPPDMKMRKNDSRYGYQPKYNKDFKNATPPKKE